MASLEERLERARAELRQRGFEASHAVVSPHRICPLGAHSDHQHGPVLGLGIDLFTGLAFAPRDDPVVSLSSADFPGEVEIDLRGPVRPLRDTSGGWGRYALGVATLLRERLPAPPRGLTGRLTGALPGGGLSSSASNVVAQLYALAAANGLRLPDDEWVGLARRVENDFAGVACGVLDPACVVGARRGRLLRIDTATLRWEAIAGPPAPAVRFLVAYTGRRRHLAGTAFNVRVEECFAAARALGAARLGELDDRVFEERGGELDEAPRRRAAHFFGERRRVEAGVEQWRRGDLEGFGAAMRESCRSSIELYETGSPELVALQEIWESSEGVLGARFSGAGFGGCSIALARADAAADLCAEVPARFRRAFPDLADARVFAVDSEDGARVLELD